MGSVRAFAWLFLGGLASVTGCSGPAEGPLVFDEFGEMLVAQDTPVYFGVPLCIEGEPASVTFSRVEAVQVTGTARPITFRIAWPDGPPFDRVNADFGPGPAAYVPVEGASGEVGTCGGGEARYRYGVLAVVVPSTEREPVSVRDLRVTYEVSDRAFTEVVDVSLTQCPDGTRPATTADRCSRGRATH